MLKSCTDFKMPFEIEPEDFIEFYNFNNIFGDSTLSNVKKLLCNGFKNEKNLRDVAEHVINGMNKKEGGRYFCIIRP